MKIAFLGNFSVPYSSESHYLSTFRDKLGIEVDIYQEREPIKLKSNEYDMFFWVHTHNWDTPGLDAVLSSLKSANIPIVGYHLDLWLGIEREKDLETDPYWRELDYFFSVDRLMVDWLNARPDYPEAYFLPAGVVESECVPGRIRKEYAHDIIFVGSRGYHKEWPYREQLISWLESKFGSKFAHYGGGGRGTIRGQELNDLYASAKIVIGDTLCKDFTYPYYLSDRIFETTGRGGFLIHPYIKGIEDFFELPTTLNDNEWQQSAYNTKDAELITYNFGGFEYLEYLIAYYLHNEDERESVKIRGHLRTKTEHTYTQRIESIIKTVIK